MRNHLYLFGRPSIVLLRKFRVFHAEEHDGQLHSLYVPLQPPMNMLQEAVT